MKEKSSAVQQEQWERKAAFARLDEVMKELLKNRLLPSPGADSERKGKHKLSPEAPNASSLKS